MRNLIWAILGGGIGAGARYAMTGAVHRFVSTSFPYGTLAVNVLGCLLMGFMMSLFSYRFVASPALRVFLTVGILGGFTTYSSFSYETLELMRDAEYALAFGNIALTLVLCLGATWIGLELGKLL